MQPTKLSPTKIRTHEFRASFPNLFRPGVYDGKESGYSITALFENNKKTKLLRKMIEEAISTAIEEKWSKRPKKVRLPEISDDSDRPEAEGMISVSFRSNNKPQYILDARREPIEDPSEIYGGCYGIAVIQVYAWDNAFGKGVSLGLLGFQKSRDGEPFVGGASIDDFEDVDEDEGGHF